MASAIACPPPKDSTVRRVYHFTTAEHGLNNVSLSRLKIARISDANDPFEFMAVSYRKKGDRAIAERYKHEANLTTGFLSFSKDWAEPLLWSHYSDRHRGMCLGFDVPRTDVECVKYVSPRALIALNDPDKSALPADVVDLARQKYEGWTYEGEVRRYVELGRASCRERVLCVV